MMPLRGVRAATEVQSRWGARGNERSSFVSLKDLPSTMDGCVEPGKWTDLGNGYECKWKYSKEGGRGLVMFRLAGQSSEYPHDTVFFRPDTEGELDFWGEHESQSRRIHSLPGQVRINLGFFIQSVRPAATHYHSQCAASRRKLICEAQNRVKDAFDGTNDFANPDAWLRFLAEHYAHGDRFIVAYHEIVDVSGRKVCRFRLGLRE